MAFSGQTVWEAWLRSKGRCECMLPTHGHSGTCGRPLRWEERGREGGLNAWEAHHRTSPQMGGDDSLDNCEILCWRCHKARMTDDNPGVRDSTILKRKWRINLPHGRKRPVR